MKKILRLFFLFLKKEKNETKYTYLILGRPQRPNSKPKRRVNKITADMLREEERMDKRISFYTSHHLFATDIFTDNEFYKSEILYRKKRDDELWEKHFKIHVRLSIKQTK